MSITAVDGRTVTVDDRGAMSGVPAVLHTGQVGYRGGPMLAASDSAA